MAQAINLALLLRTYIYSLKGHSGSSAYAEIGAFNQVFKSCLNGFLVERGV